MISKSGITTLFIETIFPCILTSYSLFKKVLNIEQFMLDYTSNRRYDVRDETDGEGLRKVWAYMDQHKGYAGSLPVMWNLPLVRRIVDEHMPCLRALMVLPYGKDPSEMSEMQDTLLGIRNGQEPQELHDVR